jgi:NAD(P)-dependent dehydrogenase (short-subunit alcohol dehydrogenase family)
MNLRLCASRPAGPSASCATVAAAYRYGVAHPVRKREPGRLPRPRDSDALASAIASLAERLGAVEVLEYSPLPAPEFMKPILETTVEDVRGPLEFSVLGAVAAARAVLDPMREAGRGTILYTTGGAAINPYPLRAGVGISFAGEVAYARMLHDELADQGIHVAHTAIAGRIAPGADHEPADVADVLWSHHVDRATFQTRIGFDDERD